MNKGLATFIYGLTILLSSFIGVCIRTFHTQTAFYLTISSLILYLSSLIILFSEKKNPIESFKGLKPFYSSLNAIGTISRMIGHSLLPVSVSVPLLNLQIVFTYIFNYILNNYKFILTDYIAIPLIIIGSIVVNLDKIFGSKSSSNNHNMYIYIFGIICILLSTIISGYTFNVFYDLDKKDGEIETVNVSYMIMAFIVSIVYPIGLYFGKIALPEFKSSMILIAVAIFLLTIPIYIRYYLYTEINETIAMGLSSVSIVLGVIFAKIFLKESLNIYKIIGIIIIIIGMILASYGKDIIKEIKIR
jgi:drug/metabolite transporter (DMT)-like permease